MILTRGTFHAGGEKNHGGEDVGPNTLREIEELCHTAMEFADAAWSSFGESDLTVKRLDNAGVAA